MLRRIYPAAIISLVLGTLGPGCALQEGRPWGELHTSLRVSQDLSERLGPSGQVRTSRNYLLQIETLEIGVSQMGVTLTTGQGAAGGFDPANPPAGYSNCHNGHCHSARGGLVDYADIALELGVAPLPARELAGPVDRQLALPGEHAFSKTGPCPEGCDLERETIATGFVTVDALRVVATVRDERQGTEARLGPDGLRLVLDVPLDARLETELGLALDRGEDPRVALDLEARITERLWDRVDFGAPDFTTESAAAQIMENLVEYSELKAAVSRRNL